MNGVNNQVSDSSGEGRERREAESTAKNWPLMRKVEALVFLAMFLAVPLFAFRVLFYTHSQLVVRSVSRELVQDLVRSKAIALKRNVDVQVTGSSTLDKYNRYSYAISTPTSIIEEIVLPENVSVAGSVLFKADGHPERPSSFVVSSFNRNMTVEIDKIGVVTVP